MSIKHRCVGTPEYQVWSSMRQRCLNPNDKAFPRYGGRGIVVCDRWTEFASFLEDMGLRPNASYTLERVNNDGPYSPENCKWATRFEQQSNTRKNVRITFDGETKTLSQWSRFFNIPHNTLRHRLNVLKLPLQQVFNRGRITWQELECSGTIRNKPCAICRSTFPTRTDRQLYCSQLCAREGRLKHQSERRRQGKCLTKSRL